MNLRIIMNWNKKEDVLEKVGINGKFLQYASDELKDDEDIVKLAISNNKEILQFASFRLQKKFE